MRLLGRAKLRLLGIIRAGRTPAEGIGSSRRRRRASIRLAIGIGLIVLSYLLGWPLIGVLGGIAVHLGKPVIFSIGSPAAYAFSYLVLFAGLMVAGSQGTGYVDGFVRRLARIGTRKVSSTKSHCRHRSREEDPGSTRSVPRK